jgi:hypothetical protein
MMLCLLRPCDGRHYSDRLPVDKRGRRDCEGVVQTNAG